MEGGAGWDGSRSPTWQLAGIESRGKPILHPAVWPPHQPLRFPLPPRSSRGLPTDRSPQNRRVREKGGISDGPPLPGVGMLSTVEIHPPKWCAIAHIITRLPSHFSCRSRLA